MNSKFLFLLFLPILSIDLVSAHCPLCTLGAGAAAAGATWAGISKVVVGLFVGAFAISLGMWFAKAIKKKYIPFQKTFIVLIIFITTVFPLLPIFSAIGPLYISFIGEYGKTYAIDYSLFSSILGGIITFSSPYISKNISKRRMGKIIPFQGVIITLASLIIIGGAIQAFI
ncbi:MAG: hypothetical protein WDZ77_03010 [Candidatus Pacearchaeota archaeon]